MCVSRYGRVRVLSAKGQESWRYLGENSFVEDNFAFNKPMENFARLYASVRLSTSNGQKAVKEWINKSHTKELAESLRDLIYHEQELDSESLRANLVWVFEDGVKAWVNDLKDQEAHDWLDTFQLDEVSWDEVEKALQEEFEEEWERVVDEGYNSIKEFYEE